MRKTLFRILVLLIITLSLAFAQSSVDQNLFIVQNDQTNGGNFKVAVQVKGTSLPLANTLANATIDIEYNDSHLSYVDATLWAFGSSLGYTRNADFNTDAGTFIRVGVLGSTVNGDGGGVPPGFDIINDSYTSWVTLNFTIDDANVSTNLFIRTGSNAVSLWPNHANNPTGTPISQSLTRNNINNAPLPIELTKFTGKILGDKVELIWVTKTEVDNYGFEVERASSMTSPIQGWAKIGFVPGHGNSNSPKDYSFTDKNPSGGSKFIYRLKQIDNAGKLEYSKEVEIEMIPDQFELFQNYPNPFNPVTNIKFALPKVAKVTLLVYNLLGEKVATLLNEDKEAGFFDVQFDARNFSSGVYIFRLTTDDFVQTKKMTLMK